MLSSLPLPPHSRNRSFRWYPLKPSHSKEPENHDRKRPFVRVSSVKCYFFELPRELRDEILSYLVVYESPLESWVQTSANLPKKGSASDGGLYLRSNGRLIRWIRGPWTAWWMGSKPPNMSRMTIISRSVFQVNRQMRDEAAELFFRRNTFKLGGFSQVAGLYATLKDSAFPPFRHITISWFGINKTATEMKSEDDCLHAHSMAFIAFLKHQCQLHSLSIHGGVFSNSPSQIAKIARILVAILQTCTELQELRLDLLATFYEIQHAILARTEMKVLDWEWIHPNQKPWWIVFRRTKAVHTCP